MSTEVLTLPALRATGTFFSSAKYTGWPTIAPVHDRSERPADAYILMQLKPVS